jgi:5-methylcytosine-specific restriction protein A
MQRGFLHSPAADLQPSAATSNPGHPLPGFPEKAETMPNVPRGTATCGTPRISGRKGMRLRSMFLRAHPLCVHCAERGRVRAATEVDHIVALTFGGPDSWDNRQSLCAECHRIKTNRDLGYRKRMRCDVNGYPVDDDHPWSTIKQASTMPSSDRGG